MQFNSYIFILLFLPLSVLFYFLFNRISSFAGKILLIVASIIFYAYADTKTVLILCVSLAFNYLFSFLIKKYLKWHKMFMAIPVLLNVLILLYFKYTNFFISSLNSAIGSGFALKNLIIPVGISFITFQQIAYVVAIYSGELEKLDLVDYLTFILYFPKILMGPLTDPVDFITQLNDENLKTINWDNIVCGIKIFSFGLVKKAFFADTLAKAVAWSYNSVGATNSMDWILTGIFYTMEIYFDFSGYADMATGVSLMMNITLPINFNSPLKSVSFKDFWNRWHISLSKFFVKYIYIPLGGSRKGRIISYINLMIVFLVSGIWHGANWTYILWGVFHGIISIIEHIMAKRKIKIYEPFGWFFTIFFGSIFMLLFRADSISQWREIMKIMISMENTTVGNGILSAFELPEFVFFSNAVPFVGRVCNSVRGFWMLAFMCVSGFICFVPENGYNNLHKKSLPTMILAAIAFVWGFICLGGESVFVYFNF